MIRQKPGRSQAVSTNVYDIYHENYNDLKGMDEVFIREILISIGYAMFNSGSLKIALGSQASVSRNGIICTSIISAVILTTMQIQDLKDKEGDKLRGRKTIVLHFGDRVSRSSVAFFVLFWSCICARFWCLSALASATLSLSGGWVSMRVWTKRGRKEDRRNWQLWCLWLVCLYALPVLQE